MPYAEVPGPNLTLGSLLNLLPQTEQGSHQKNEFAVVSLCEYMVTCHNREVRAYYYRLADMVSKQDILCRRLITHKYYNVRLEIDRGIFQRTCGVA